MRGIFFRRGQNLAELALIIGIVGLVFIGMEIYVKRGMQGKVKNLADYIISDKQSAEAPNEDAVDRVTETTSGSVLTSEEFEGGGGKLSGTEDSSSTYRPPIDPLN